MQIYLVGGAVRDLIMGIPNQDLDYVVVGSSVEEMINLGFIPVGQNFPVFLHPKTKQEYALARTEKKIAKGYKGFSFFADKSVTLEEDLSRRDLTINAIALPITPNTCNNKFDLSKIIDPFNGLADIKNKILRHVSSAFLEDPVRILRIARFRARYNFQIHETTLDLMRKMVVNNEIKALVPERIWQEISKALVENYPTKFFYSLWEINAIEIIFPELVDNFENNMLKMLSLESLISKDLEINFTILMLNLDKTSILSFCKRLKVNKNLEELAISSKLTLKKLQSIRSSTDILDILNTADGFRRKDRFIKIMNICEKYYAMDKKPYYFNKDKMIEHLENCLKIDIKNLIDKNSNLSTKEQVYQFRLKAIN